jgi:putative phosphoribosyl transferase
MFADRAEAGRELASVLCHLRPEQPIILALPRGGVVVGFEVAKALNAILDLLLIRKIGAPDQPELAIAAVVDGASPQLVVNEDLAASIGVDQRYIAEQKALKLKEIERLRERYLAWRRKLDLSGASAIVVDDGIATGATMKAALAGLRKVRLRHLILAVPVAPRDTVEALRTQVDELFCLETPEPFRAVGAHYVDFRQVTDDEVIELLRRAWRITDAARLDGLGP